MPRHEEIERLIRQKVVSGDFRSGAMLPGRRELAKTFNTSTITVGRAIEALEKEGILRSDDRRGTFVSDTIDHSARMPSARELRIAVVATLFLPPQDMGFGHNVWTRQVVASLEQELAGAEHETLFINTVLPNGSTIHLDEAVCKAIEAGVDGVIALAFTNGVAELQESEKLLAEAGVPCVIVSSMEVNRTVPHVFPDGYDAGFQAGQHLIRQGCKRAAFIAPRRAWWMQHRHMGAAAAFEQAGFGAEAVLAYPSEPTTEWDIRKTLIEASHNAALVAFESFTPDLGVIGANDEIAKGAMMAGRSLGYEPGRDYALVGFDDIPEARALDLTSMRIPWDAVGAEAARLLRQALARQGECLQVRVRWKLIPRASSRMRTGKETRLVTGES